MSDDTETTFPSTTFDAEFNGCGAMTADFKGDVKFKVDDLPRTLGQIHGLRCKKFQLTLVSDQSQIPDGGAADGWAHPELTDDDESDIEYERTCVGPKCRPYFCVPKEGDLVGEYVCYKDPDALMVCVRGETLCPMGVDDEDIGETDADDSGDIPAETDAEGEAIDEAVDDLVDGTEPRDEDPDLHAVVGVWYPGEKHVRTTDVGEHTLYAEFVADYLATLPVKDARKDDALDLYRVVDNVLRARPLDMTVDPAEYGGSFWVEAIATAEEPAA